MEKSVKDEIRSNLIDKYVQIYRYHVEVWPDPGPRDGVSQREYDHRQVHDVQRQDPLVQLHFEGCLVSGVVSKVSISGSCYFSSGQEKETDGRLPSME